jgi:hypothetical protein
VIYSLTTSTHEDAPQGMHFFPFVKSIKRRDFACEGLKYFGLLANGKPASIVCSPFASSDSQSSVIIINCEVQDGIHKA